MDRNKARRSSRKVRVGCGNRGRCCGFRNQTPAWHKVNLMAFKIGQRRPVGYGIPLMQHNIYYPTILICPPEIPNVVFPPLPSCLNETDRPTRRPRFDPAVGEAATFGRQLGGLWQPLLPSALRCVSVHMMCLKNAIHSPTRGHLFNSSVSRCAEGVG